MENFELHIEPEFNRKTGRFYPGHIPFNKGKKQTDWMDGRKIKRVKKYLEIGRKLGNHDLPGKNKIEIVGIKDGKLIAFKSSTDAEMLLRAKGIKVNARNIRAVCLGTKDKLGYVRLKAGGYRWFQSKDVEKYKHFLK